MKNGMCAYDCVCACVCVCVANGCTYMFDSLGSEGVKEINAHFQTLGFNHREKGGVVRNYGI